MTKKKSSKSKQIDRKGNGCFDVKPQHGQPWRRQ